jgi:hypothetical protein
MRQRPYSGQASVLTLGATVVPFRRAAPLLPLLLLAVLLVAAPALAGSWTGNGTYTVSSTPSVGSPCTGRGTTHLSLTEDSGSLTGTLTFTLTSQSSGCNGGLSNSGTAYLTGTISGGSIQASDQASDTWTGTLSGGSVSLSLVSPRQGGGCAAYCQQTGQFSYTGSGDIAGGVSFASLPLAAAATGALFGLSAVGMGLASMRAPRTFRSTQGYSYKYDNGVFTRLDGPAPSNYQAPTPPPPPATVMAPPAPPPPAPEVSPILGPGTVGGPTTIEGPIGGVFQGTPDIAPPPNPPTGLGQTQGGPSCPVHRGNCIPALENLGPGPALRWFCPIGGHYPWG